MSGKFGNSFSDAAATISRHQPHRVSMMRRNSALFSARFADLVLNCLLEGFEGKLTTSKWAAQAPCSQDTAYRDILRSDRARRR
jgi:Fic family protein